jgi:lysophospholipase L1-like esterase
MKYFTLLLLLLTTYVGAAQNIKWDDTVNKVWPPNFEKVLIKSNFDNTLQPSIVYKSTSKVQQPLIVSLHTWGGDYLQQDSLCYQVENKNWNYIHPNFRGANNQPQAMGSEAVVQDIDDAVDFAVKNMNVDPNEVHIIGVSGGGYAAMLCYMQLKYPAKSFSSWAGISDLKAWYEESTGRRQRYAADILKSTSSEKNKLNIKEAIKRSPLYMNVPVNRGKLYLYEGIHDGYQGSVPITQTLNMYNRIVQKLYPDHSGSLVKESEMLDMVVKRCLPGIETQMILGNRKVHYFKDNKDVSLCIFEGNHEMLLSVALSLIPTNNAQLNKRFSILTLGDSNGTFNYGWPQQLKYEIPYMNLLNISKVGKTIGFNNNGDSSLNQIISLRSDFKIANQFIDLQKFDYILIGLGTNDAKAIFKKDQKKVLTNLELLIKQIRNSEYSSINTADIVILSPPPFGNQSQLQEKYIGGMNRVKKMNIEFKKIALKHHCLFVDGYTQMLPYINSLSKDGIHMNREGQRKIASLIGTELRRQPVNAPLAN